jgi:hypothetical protein
LAEILILSAGRRVSLCRAFVAAAAQRGVAVAAADMKPEMSSACRDVGQAYNLPHVRSADYPAALEALCRAQGVRLVVPTIDTELPVLAALKDHFATFGCALAVSDLPLVQACDDKRLTASYFAANGVRSPAILDKSALAFPAIMKPFDGSLSVGIKVLRAPEDVLPADLRDPRNMFCQYLDPAVFQEFTCDAYFDRTGTMRCVIPRLRVEVRGGEVSKGLTVRNNIVDYLREGMGHLAGAFGCLTIQVMRNAETGEIFLIEVNPRFGGGYPLTAESGGIFHEWLIDECLFGKAIPDFDGWQDGLLMLRYDAAVFVSPSDA